MQRLQDDMSTFDDYVVARSADLFRFAIVLVGERQLAEDVVQDVLLRVHQRWADIGALERRDAYVRRMIVNEFLSWRRRWSRITPVAEIDARDNPLPDIADVVVVRDELTAAISRLPRRQLTAIVLRFHCGLDDHAIADLMGCRAVTVRGYISRALRTLRIDLTDAPDQERI